MDSPALSLLSAGLALLAALIFQLLVPAGERKLGADTNVYISVGGKS